MKQEELIKAIAYAEVLWSTFRKEEEETKQQLQLKMWWEFLKPYDLEVVYASMRELAKESDFCNIAKVAKGCQTICNLNNNMITEDDVFNEIDKAIGYYGAKEKFEKLSPIAKKVVGDASRLASWGMCDISEFNTVVASQIRRSIRNELQRQEKIESVGMDTLKQLETQTQLQIGNGDDEKN